ncbi:MAG: sensor histidine kinase [Acidobacteria bacterium]|nr:sensor histidine kinase [Acidobacteriota bacterium]MBI3427390.1 sensor histidine kinase [Acidobacteriota bacterium]
MTKTFSIDARTILTLGRDSIKDHTTALVELVKNSYDADATKVEVGIFSNVEEPYIRVADNGCGMTEQEIDTRWLRIGYSEKVEERISSRNRRRTGEKGIGRISADRLGAVLELRTRVESGVFGLSVDWRHFDVRGKNLAEVPVEILTDSAPRLPRSIDGNDAQTGTELIIKELRQSWTKPELEDLHRELSLLTSPFKQASDFHIKLDNDIDIALSGGISSKIYETAVITLEVSFNGEQSLKYHFTDRINGAKVRRPQQTITWRELIYRPTQKDQRKPNCGPVSMKLMFFPRKEETIEGSEFSLSDLRQFMESNAGVSVYRDHIRVKPYGNPKEGEGDWLGLGKRLARNPAGAGRATFRISPNQLVGAVFISRDRNHLLTDSSSREGLVHGEAFSDLKALALGCVQLLETHYHKRFTEEKATARKGVSPAEETRELKRELNFLKKDLRSIAPMMAQMSEEAVERVLERVESVTTRIQGTQKSLAELQSQTTIYRGLATIGIAATVFGHETQTSIAGFDGAAHVSYDLLMQTPPRMSDAVEQLEVALEYASKVSAWGKFALARIKREKRRRATINVEQLVKKVIVELQPNLDALDIETEIVAQPVEAKTVAMDIEAVLINLLTNAYTFCQQGNGHRRIRVDVGPKVEDGQQGFEIVVADSGPGVAKEFRDRIWTPLFTTKTDADGNQVGTGLGLAIVQSVVNDLKGSRKVDTDPDLKGARVTVWLPSL